MRRPDALRALLLAGALTLAACGDKQEEAKQAAPPPPPPPPKQEVPQETVADVAKRLGIDPRVRMDESERPRGGDAAADLKRLEATLKFFDAMVTAKADALRPMLSDRDRSTLAAMEKDGQWKVVNRDVERVIVGVSGDKVLAAYLRPQQFDGQLWQVSEIDGALRFTAMPCPPAAMRTAEGPNTERRVQTWEALLRYFTDQASVPDEVVEVPQQDRSVKGEDSTPASGSQPQAPPTNPGSPGSPGGTPRRPGR